MRLRLSVFLRFTALLLAFSLVACAPLPPSPADLQAKRFEPLPDKGVIYLFRNHPDFSDEGTALTVDGSMQGTTYPGTYMRLELPPGVHLISGFAGDAGAIKVEAVPGEIVFVQQSVMRMFLGPPQSRFRLVHPQYGQDAVLRHELVGSR